MGQMSAADRLKTLFQSTNREADHARENFLREVSNAGEDIVDTCAHRLRILVWWQARAEAIHRASSPSVARGYTRTADPVEIARRILEHEGEGILQGQWLPCTTNQMVVAISLERQRSLGEFVIEIKKRLAE